MGICLGMHFTCTVLPQAVKGTRQGSLGTDLGLLSPVPWHFGHAKAN